MRHYKKHYWVHLIVNDKMVWYVPKLKRFSLEGYTYSIHSNATCRNVRQLNKLIRKTIKEFKHGILKIAYFVGHKESEGKHIVASVATFACRGHARYFDDIGDVKDRYSPLIDIHEIHKLGAWIWFKGQRRNAQ